MTAVWLGSISGDMADPDNWMDGILPKRGEGIDLHDIGFDPVWPADWNWPTIPLVRFFGGVTLDLFNNHTTCIGEARGMDGQVSVKNVKVPITFTNRRPAC